MKHQRPNALIIALVVLGAAVVFSLPIIFNTSSPINDQTSQYEAESNFSGEGSGTTSIEDVLDAVDEHKSHRRVKTVVRTNGSNETTKKSYGKKADVKPVKSSRTVNKVRRGFGALYGMAGALEAAGRRRGSE